jgi:Metal binding domain of Ada
MELPSEEVCYRALQSRDARFDGLIYVGVRTTGIYCRPVCPARTAKQENCRFFGSAAAAQEEGFRPCLRCRPETAPNLASWRGTSNTVTRALTLINEGALDGDDASVETLAARLGVGERQPAPATSKMRSAGCGAFAGLENGRHSMSRCAHCARSTPFPPPTWPCCAVSRDSPTNRSGHRNCFRGRKSGVRGVLMPRNTFGQRRLRYRHRRKSK